MRRSAQTELISLLAGFKTQILSKAVQHDPLTGLPLRYGVENDFVKHQKEAQRNRALLYVVMIDIDHFKRSTILRPSCGRQGAAPIGDILKRMLRGNEPLYRFGGRSFSGCSNASLPRRRSNRRAASWQPSVQRRCGH